MECFYKLNVKSECRQKLLEYALSVEDWLEDTNNNQLTFLQKKVPINLVADDPVLGRLIKEDTRIKIFKTLANTFYHPHKDSHRGAAINLILNNDYNSHTFFTIGKYRTSQSHIKYLDYEKDTYYLLNTQIPHAVLTLNSDRYVLSFGFGPNDISVYSQTRDNLIQLGF